MASPRTSRILLTLLLLVSSFAAVGPSTTAFVPDGEAPPDPERPPFPDPGEDAWVAEDVALVGFWTVAPPLLPALVATHGGSIERVDTLLRFAKVRVPAEAVDAFLEEAGRALGVSYAKREGLVRASFVPDDPLYAGQWGPPAIHMPEAWDLSTGNHEITVAIIDTGVDYSHEDLAANVCALGPDYVNSDADPMDDHYHGTHVAGTVAGVLGNGVGVAGMANACLMPVKVLSSGGWGYWGDVASALVWAADHGAKIISMSLGGCPGCDPGEPVTSAMQYAAGLGVLIVSAAGNAYCDPVGYPAAYNESVAVASLDNPGDETSSFSSCGEKVEIAAPGRDVLSSLPTFYDPSGYGTLSGTSMATPHVSGVAALLWAANPLLTAMDVRCILAQNADDIMEPGRDVKAGFGRINALAALSNPHCEPELPAAPRLSGFSGDGTAALGWSAPFAWGAITGYNVYRGADASSLELLAALGPTTTYEDLAVAAGQPYTYAVSALNGAGEGPLSNALAVTPMAAHVPPYLENVETGAPGWTATGQWHVTTDRAASGSAFYFGSENGPGLEDNTFDPAAPAGVLESPPLSLVGLADAHLSYWNFFGVYGYGYAAPTVLVATKDSPNLWTPLVSLAGPEQDEGTMALDLAPYLGAVVHLRFALRPLAGTGAEEGWYLDDILVDHGAPPNLPPRVTGVVPWEGEWANVDGAVGGWYFDGNGPQDVERVEFRIDDGPWTNATLYPFYWLEPALFTGGDHVAEARAYDRAGLVSAIDSWAFRVDLTPPTAELTAPEADSTWGCTVGLEGVARDLESGIRYVVVTVDGWWADVAWFPDGLNEQPFAIALDLSWFGAGPHTVGVVPIDRVGNQGTETAVPIVKESANCYWSIEILTPQDGAGVFGPTTITGTLTPPDEFIPLDHVRLILYGGGGSQSFVIAADGGNWSFEWNTTGLEPDRYGIRAYPVDVNGRYGFSDHVSVRVVRAAPRLEAVQREGTLACATPLLFTVEQACGLLARFVLPVDADLTQAKIEVRWSGDGVADELDDLRVEAVGNGFWYSEDATDSDGDHVVLFVDRWDEYLTDGPDNVTVSILGSRRDVNVAVLQPFTLEVTWSYNFALIPAEPPSLQILLPENGDKFGCTLEVRLSTVVDPVARWGYVEAYANGAWIGSAGGYDDGTPFDAAFDLSEVPGGPFTLEVVLRDGRDREDSESLDLVKLPRDPAQCVPRIEVETPAEGDVVKGLVPIEGEVSVPDEREVAWLDVSVDGYTVGSSYGETTFAFEWDASQFTAGPHRIGVWAMDSTGTWAQESFEVIVERPPMERYEYADTLGCAVGLPSFLQTTDLCGTSTVRSPVLAGLTAARLKLTWDEGGAVPDDLDDLGLRVVIDGLTYRGNPSSAGNGFVFEITAPAGGVLADQSGDAVIQVVGARDDGANVAFDEDYELAVTWAYDGTPLP